VGWFQVRTGAVQERMGQGCPSENKTLTKPQIMILYLPKIMNYVVCVCVCVCVCVYVCVLNEVKPLRLTCFPLEP
jgi:hypothetical protein